MQRPVRHWQKFTAGHASAGLKERHTTPKQTQSDKSVSLADINLYFGIPEFRSLALVYHQLSDRTRGRMESSDWYEPSTDTILVEIRK
jgi:hypothetical protein